MKDFLLFVLFIVICVHYATTISTLYDEIYILKKWTEKRVKGLSDYKQQEACKELGELIANNPKFSLGRDWYRSFFCNKK